MSDGVKNSESAKKFPETLLAAPADSPTTTVLKFLNIEERTAKRTFLLQRNYVAILLTSTKYFKHVPEIKKMTFFPAQENRFFFSKINHQSWKLGKISVANMVQGQFFKNYSKII